MKSDKKKDALLSMIRQGKPMTLGEQARLVMFLATPAILAQLTTTMMQYIDASMVGSMGAQASASIGLMETTMWLLGSICSASAAGFYVQVSHQLGSNDPARARNTLRQGIMSVLVVSALIGLVSLARVRSCPCGWAAAATSRPRLLPTSPSWLRLCPSSSSRYSAPACLGVRAI